MKPPPLPPERGDLIQVDWVDIREDINGDPDAARLARRTSYGLFWTRAEDDGVAVLVTTTTVDHDEDISGQSGFCVYPEACIRRLRVVRRARRERRKKVRVEDAKPKDHP